MAEKIDIEIGLDGGAEVTRQLEDIGQAGQRAFSDIQSAADQVNLQSTTEQFDNLGTAGQAAFQKVQAAAQNAVAFEQVIQGVKKVEGAFESLGTAVSRMAARMTRSLGIIGVAARALGPVGIAVGALGGAFLKFGDDAADALNKLTSAGAKLGLTAQQLDGLQKSLGRLGVSPDAITSGLEKMAESFGGDLIRNLEKFIEQLQRMPDSIQRTQLAIQTLGESLGSQVIAGLETGTISAGKFAKAIASAGPATQEQIGTARRYQEALNQLSQAWTELKAAFVPITTPILGFFASEIKALASDIKAFIIDVKALATFLQALGAVFTAQGPEQMRAAIQGVADAFKQLGTGAQQVAQQTKNALDTTAQAVMGVGQAAEEAKAPLKGLFDRLATDAQVVGEAISTNLAQGISQGAQQAATAIDPVTQKWAQLQQAAQAANLPVSQLLNLIPLGAQNSANALDMIAERLNQIMAAANAATGAVVRMGSALVDASGPGFGTPGVGSGTPGVGFAGGGFIGGRGTGTSDSNLAWVSRGEHIMPARAVGQPGVLSFLEALRRSGGNLRGVLDGLGRFAVGGLVPRAMPAFASGGPVGGSNVTIQFPGLPPISGLRASSSVVDELHRAAALAQVRSGGRKPSRYS